MSDMAWVPSEHRFAAILNRFEIGWQPLTKMASPVCAGAGVPCGLTRLSAAREHRVSSPGEPSAFAELLAVTYEEGEPPSGYITLYFAGGGAVRLEVESSSKEEFVRPWRGLENCYESLSVP